MKFDESSIYEVVIQGNLSSSLEEILGQIDDLKTKGQKTSTFTLTIKDQAHLCSLVNTLYDHRYPILSLKHKQRNTHDSI